MPFFRFSFQVKKGEQLNMFDSSAKPPTAPSAPATPSASAPRQTGQHGAERPGHKYIRRELGANNEFRYWYLDPHGKEYEGDENGKPKPNPLTPAATGPVASPMQRPAQPAVQGGQTQMHLGLRSQSTEPPRKPGESWYQENRDVAPPPEPERSTASPSQKKPWQQDRRGLISDQANEKAQAAKEAEPQQEPAKEVDTDTRRAAAEQVFANHGQELDRRMAEHGDPEPTAEEPKVAEAKPKQQPFQFVAKPPQVTANEAEPAQEAPAEAPPKVYDPELAFTSKYDKFESSTEPIEINYPAPYYEMTKDDILDSVMFQTSGLFKQSSDAYKLYRRELGKAEEAVIRARDNGYDLPKEILDSYEYELRDTNKRKRAPISEESEAAPRELRRKGRAVENFAATIPSEVTDAQLEKMILRDGIEAEPRGINRILEIIGYRGDADTSPGRKGDRYARSGMFSESEYKDGPNGKRIWKIIENLEKKGYVEVMGEKGSAARRTAITPEGARNLAGAKKSLSGMLGRLFEKLVGRIRKNEEIEDAGKETETEPSEGQKKAGNYKKGKVQIQGLTVTIENPAGSIRRGVDASGEEWACKMKNDYGYINRTVDHDGDQVDVFLGKAPDSDRVYIIDQNKENGRFDEHKVMLGFESEKDAKKAYKANYDDDREQYIGCISDLSMDEFKEWLEYSKPNERASEYRDAEKSALILCDLLKAIRLQTSKPDHSELNESAQTPKDETLPGETKVSTDGVAYVLGQKDSQSKPRWHRAYIAERLGEINNLTGMKKLTDDISSDRKAFDEAFAETEERKIIGQMAFEKYRDLRQKKANAQKETGKEGEKKEPSQLQTAINQNVRAAINQEGTV